VYLELGFCTFFFELLLFFAVDFASTPNQIKTTLQHYTNMPARQRNETPETPKKS